MTDETKTPEELEAEKAAAAAAAEEAEKAAAEAAAADKPKAAPKTRKKTQSVELGAEVDLGDKPGHLCFPDGGVSSHKGPARFTVAGDYRFVTADGETTYRVK